MFVKTVYGEVENSAWYGQDVTFKEVNSVEEGREAILQTIDLDHDYPDEWLASDVEQAKKDVDSLQEDEERVRVRSSQARDGDTYSVYEYSIVSEQD